MVDARNRVTGFEEKPKNPKPTPGNPGAVGARVTVEVPGLPLQTAERSAGSGYLTQNGPDLHFGWGLAGSDAASAKVTVRWPDGESTSHALTREEGPRYLIEAQP
jgi:hypothetical protein